MKEHPTPSMSGTTSGYSVEARWAYPSPKQLGDQIFDREWRKVNFTTAPVGVPMGDTPWNGGLFLRSFGLMSFTAAQALRWWFLSECNAAEGHTISCMETRIVAHRVKYSASAERAEPMNYEPASAEPAKEVTP